MVASAERELVEVAMAAEWLGVDLENSQIDGKMKGLDRKLNAVEVMLKKVPNMNDNTEDASEIVIVGSAEVDYPDDIKYLEVSLSDATVPPVKCSKKKTRSSSSQTMNQLCKECGISFATKIGFEKHLNIVHEKDKPRPFVCDTCKNRFSSIGSLHTHRLLHTARKSFKCEDCDYAAAQKGNLKAHRLRHHKNIIGQVEDDSPAKDKV